MNVEEQQITSENIPRSFSEIPGLWFKFGIMTETFFTKEINRTSVSNTIWGVLIYTVSAAILSVSSSVLGFILGTSRPIGSPLPTPQFIIFLAILGCCVSLFSGPLVFYLSNGIIYVVALILGGKGNFNSQAYLYSLFYVPLGLIAGLASFSSLIPNIGRYIVSILYLSITVINIQLAIRILKVVHSFTTGRALAVIFLPLLLLLIPICIIIVLMLIGPMIRNVFSSINSSLATPAP
jgi:hypothetical protein